MRFKDKIAVVTGGGSGMGLAAAQLLAEEGAIVAVNDINPETVDQTVDILRSRGGQALAIPGDVSDLNQVEDNVRSVMNAYGRIDVLLSNAGLPIFAAPEDYTDWKRSLAVNVDGMFYWAKTVGKEAMIPQKSGAIVFTSSLAGLTAVMGDIGYVTSKHAVVGMTKAFAAEWAQHNIRVNCVAPGLTDSTMVRKNLGANPEAFAARISRVPLGRMARPDEQAKAMLFLASEDASYITGLTMQVDGGQLTIHSGHTVLGAGHQ